jgi:nucleoside 2-deoxyribosyltransferase
MRCYIAYKFLGSDKEILKEKLNIISSEIEKTGNKSFVFYRDVQKWGSINLTTKEIINSAFLEIQKSDVFFAFVEDSEKSEGLLLESGYAKALNKKIILAIKKDINLRLLRSIANEVIEFEDILDLKEKINIVF